MFYDFCACPFGKLTIVENESFITGIFLESDEEDLSGCERKYTANIKNAAVQLEEYFKCERKNFELNLRPKGTDFMQRVYRELLKIPYGETRTYKQIAREIGNERACRAVGNAINKNPVPIIIPCHRVIGSSGELVGYRYGLWMKEKLLEFERG